MMMMIYIKDIKVIIIHEWLLILVTRDYTTIYKLIIIK